MAVSSVVPVESKPVLNRATKLLIVAIAGPNPTEAKFQPKKVG